MRSDGAPLRVDDAAVVGGPPAVISDDVDDNEATDTESPPALLIEWASVEWWCPATDRTRAPKFATDGASTRSASPRAAFDISSLGNSSGITAKV